MSHISSSEVRQLDPYAFMAVIGKRVIHPGGRRSTEELPARGECRSDQQVLDIGCGVATTASQDARRFGADVTAVDIASLMLERARENMRHAGLEPQSSVERSDIRAFQ